MSEAILPDPAHVGDAGILQLDRIEILDALEHDGCPLCLVVDRAARRYLRHILHEYVLDGSLRVELARSRGFCHDHAWTLQQLELEIWRDGMGTASLYEDLARAAARKIRAAAADHRSARRTWWSEPLRQAQGLRPADDPVDTALQITGECPACSSVLRTEAYLARGLARLLSRDADIRDKFAASFGLCLPHFQFVLDACDDAAARAFLIDVEAGKLEAVAHELEDYIRKHVVGHHDEPKGREQTSWIRVIELFVGRRKRS